MSLIADILLAGGALGAGFFCLLLSRRLAAFNGLQGGIGTAIATLSSQVDDMQRAVSGAQDAACAAEERLAATAERAEAAARRLELMMASLHDLPDAGRGSGGLRVVRHRREARRDPSDRAA